jgi:hypothetical protein
MSITTVDAVYTGQGVPLYSGQIIATGGTDQVELAYKGIATLTLDGSSTTAVVNLIDGTATLPFTPSGVLLNVSGGTQQAATPISVEVVSITNTVINLKLSAAGSSANTVVVTFLILK